MQATGSQFNYIHPRVPVKSELNINTWKYYLQDYYNPLLLHFLEFGFPLGILSRRQLKSESYNHPSAENFPQDVDYYLQTEIGHQAIWGRYDHPPLDSFHTSPFLSRPKPNSTHRRMIVDLSWPKGASVNFATSSHIHMNAACALTYPTIDDMVHEAVEANSSDSCYLFKVDLERAFLESTLMTTHSWVYTGMGRITRTLGWRLGQNWAVFSANLSLTLSDI